MAQDDGAKVGFWTGFLMGGTIGILSGILVAPKSGEETRALITEKTGEWRDRAEELADSARHRVRSAVDEGRTAATRLRGRVGGTSEDLAEPDSETT